jgi:hypothetical protein
MTNKQSSKQKFNIKLVILLLISISGEIDHIPFDFYQQKVKMLSE